MNLRRIAVVCCFLAAALGFQMPSAAAWAPPSGPLFNDPSGNHAAKWRIVSRVNYAIREAVPGSKILISTYLWSDQRATGDALIAAHKRGVQVQVVIDGTNADNYETRRVAKVVNADNDAIDPATGLPYVDEAGNPLKWGPDNSFLHPCRYSCRGGPGGANHAKFYVFTKTGTATDVVMVSSANLNGGGAWRGWNDMYTVVGRSLMVDHYDGVLQEMAEDTSGDNDPFLEYQHGPYISRFYPNAPYDPVMADLAKVRCRGATDGAGRNGRTAINISMFAWQNERGLRLARRVIELARLGCDVSIIYGAPGRRVRDLLLRSSRRGEMKLYNSRIDRNRDGTMDFRVHHKYMLINGVYAGDTSSWQVHTGTANWSGSGSFRLDDNTLNVSLKGAYYAYMKNWNHIRDNWARRVR